MRKDFEISINRGRELLGIPEDILADIQAIGAIAGTMSGDGEPWVPGLVLILNGEHPITVLREITKEEWTARVHAAGVRSDWLGVPAGTRFWEIAAD